MRGGALLVMKKFQTGKVNCHTKICADEAWKSKLVLAYMGGISHPFQMRALVREVRIPHIATAASDPTQFSGSIGRGAG
jgi:hypothetical protein